MLINPRTSHTLGAAAKLHRKLAHVGGGIRTAKNIYIAEHGVNTLRILEKRIHKLRHGAGARCRDSRAVIQKNSGIPALLTRYRVYDYHGQALCKRFRGRKSAGLRHDKIRRIHKLVHIPDKPEIKHTADRGRRVCVDLSSLFPQTQII